MTRLAVAVAKLRTRYLQAALGLIGHEDGVPPDYADISSVTRARVMYEEAMHAFNAVTRAIDPNFSPLETIRDYGKQLAAERVRRDLTPRRLAELAIQGSELAMALLKLGRGPLGR